jgi:hypothetical protein
MPVKNIHLVVRHGIDVRLNEVDCACVRVRVCVFVCVYVCVRVSVYSDYMQ